MRLLLAIFLLLCGAAPANAQDEAGVRRAFLFAFPVYKLAQTRAAALAQARSDPNKGFNTFVHRQTLSDATSRAVTTPNNDTLYSSAWLDLSGGPVVLEMPALPLRYHSVALMSAFTDNVAVLGTRAQQGRGGRFLLTGPSWHGSVPKGMTRIAMPTDDGWALLRVLVDGPADLPAAAAAQSRFLLTTLSPRQPVRAWTTATPANPSAAELLTAADAALARGPMPRDRLKAAAGLARFGIAPGKVDAWKELTPAVKHSWQDQLPLLMGELRNGFTAVGLNMAGGLTRAKVWENLGRTSTIVQRSRWADWRHCPRRRRCTFQQSATVGAHCWMGAGIIGCTCHVTSRSTRFGRCRCTKSHKTGACFSLPMRLDATPSAIARANFGEMPTGAWMWLSSMISLELTIARTGCPRPQVLSA
jgi:hypothetical protein